MCVCIFYWHITRPCSVIVWTLTAISGVFCCCASSKPRVRCPCDTAGAAGWALTFSAVGGPWASNWLGFTEAQGGERVGRFLAQGKIQATTDKDRYIDRNSLMKRSEDFLDTDCKSMDLRLHLSFRQSQHHRSTGQAVAQAFSRRNAFRGAIWADGVNVQSSDGYRHHSARIEAPVSNWKISRSFRMTFFLQDGPRDLSSLFGGSRSVEYIALPQDVRLRVATCHGDVNRDMNNTLYTSRRRISSHHCGMFDISSTPFFWLYILDFPWSSH